MFKLTLVTAQIALIPDNISSWDRSHDLKQGLIHIPGNRHREPGGPGGRPHTQRIRETVLISRGKMRASSDTRMINRKSLPQLYPASKYISLSMGSDLSSGCLKSGGGFGIAGAGAGESEGAEIGNGLGGDCGDTMGLGVAAAVVAGMGTVFLLAMGKILPKLLGPGSGSGSGSGTGIFRRKGSLKGPGSASGSARGAL